ncbi:hypothetical protein H1C71_036385 [Ictidomys tridecemlineatus]|nr:hypothetical protein H1C71_036385 [Ictidomys tridecemlineatus]
MNFCLDLGLTPKIPHCVCVKIPKSKNFQTLVPCILDKGYFTCIITALESLGWVCCSEVEHLPTMHNALPKGEKTESKLQVFEVVFGFWGQPQERGLVKEDQ